MPISHHSDEVVAVTRGYGDAEKPEDFLDSFTAFVRDNMNTIAALKLVVQRPRDLTRTDLKELRLALDRKGYSEANLRRAWADAKNEEIAASIIGFVRQAALGDPLTPYEDRVRTAMRTIMASRSWTEPQKRWLKRIGEQIEKKRSSWTARPSTRSHSSRMEGSTGSIRYSAASLRACCPGSTKKCGRRHEQLVVNACV